MYTPHPLRLAPDVLAACRALIPLMLLSERPDTSSDASTGLHRRLQDVLGGVLPGHWIKAFALSVNPMKQIPLHTDAPPGGQRHHLPIQTNPLCWQFHDGTWQQLDEGQCYTMDPTLPHGAVNWGETVRVHLIIDLA